jgi:hypothetical protein
MALTSINIQPVKAGSESHNLREKELDYVKKELTPLNESISHDTIANRLETINAKYIATVGQQMQKKANPIREGVIVIDKSTEMWQLEELAKAYENRFGMRAIQIHMHNDEGHMDLITQEWKPNYHAHMVFDWTDKNTGKSVKMNRQDMAEMQTLCAKHLGMERGVSSDVKHLNALQFKAQKAQEELAKVSALVDNKETALELLKIENEKIKPKENVSKVISKTAEIALDFLGKTKNDKENDALKTEIIALKKENKTIGEKYDKECRSSSTYYFELRSEKEKVDSLKRKNNNLEGESKTLKKELGKFVEVVSEEVLNWFATNFPTLHATGLQEQKAQERNKNRQQRFEM